MSGWLLLIFFPKHPSPRFSRAASSFRSCWRSDVSRSSSPSNIRGAEGGFGSLADVATLFQKRSCCWPAGFTTSAFDLFIGGWEMRDSQRNEIPHLVVIPCLMMTFLLGPIGLLFYFAIRSAKLRSVNV